MRGLDAQQSTMFIYLSPEQRVPSGHPLRKVREMTTDRLLGELSDLFDQMYSTMGRPSNAPEKLLRALLLQVLYTVRSEPMLMEQLDYNLLLSLTGRVKTLAFRRRLSARARRINFGDGGIPAGCAHCIRNSPASGVDHEVPKTCTDGGDRDAGTGSDPGYLRAA